MTGKHNDQAATPDGSPISDVLLRMLTLLLVLLLAAGGLGAITTPAQASPAPTLATTVGVSSSVSITQQVANQCKQAAAVAWANRWNPWPGRYVVMAIGMSAACGYWIGGLWSSRAQQAWNTCWPNCPWWYAFKFW